MKIREMELLVRVAETGSMTAAASQLHLTPAAVSAAVQRIEEALSVRLFERTTRSLHATDEGLVIVEGCQDVLDRWRRTIDDVRGPRSALSGAVHLSAPADTTYQLLESVVADLCAEHPQLRVVLYTSDAIQHLHRDAIDMAIRYGPLSDSTLTARKLTDSPPILVAAPRYLAEHGAPETLAALAEHRCLTLRLSGAPTLKWRLREGGRVQHVDIPSQLCGNGYLVRRWAIAGRGIALKSLFDVVGELEDGALVRVLPGVSGESSPIHAVFPSRHFLPARVRAVDAAISACFAARAARCEAWLRMSDEP